MWDVSVPVGAVGGAIGSVVFVGDRFAPSMFDQSALFGGSVDKDTQVVVGPVAHWTYEGGLYSLTVVPNRVTVHANQAEAVMPTALADAAKQVADEIDGVRTAVLASGVGLNHDAALSHRGSVELVDGRSYCQRLFRDGGLDRITDAEPSTVTASVILGWVRGAMQYRVRIEPDASSGGERLYVAVNGHQNIGTKESVASALTHADAFRCCVEGIHAGL